MATSSSPGPGSGTPARSTPTVLSPATTTARMSSLTRGLAPGEAVGNPASSAARISRSS